MEQVGDDADRANNFHQPREAVPSMKEQGQMNQRQFVTVGQDREGIHSVPLRPPIHVQQGERNLAHVVEQVHLLQLK